MKLLIYIIILIGIKLFAQPDAEIFSVKNPNDTLVHIGPCYLQDTLNTGIHIENKGSTSIFMDGQAPSLIIFSSPTQSSPLEFRQFNRKSPGMSPGSPFVLLQNNKDTLVIEYIPSDSLVNPIGLNEANVQVAPLSVDDASIANRKIFLIRVNKTKRFLEGYYNHIQLDSVYVNPVNPLQYKWKVRSTWLNKIEVINQKMISINTQLPDEFSYIKYDTPILFPEKYRENDWVIEYKPKDIGRDTSLFQLFYKPFPINKPDSISITPLNLYGIGVKQSVAVNTSNFNYSKDTIKLGDVILGRNYNITADILNDGNLTINSLNEYIFNELNDTEYPNYQINKRFATNNTIFPDSVSDVDINLEITKYGRFVLRYVIETDILSRNIYGTPPSEKYKTIYISGRGVSPKLSLETDTLDFKNIILNSIICPSSRDTTLRISNNGNSVLRISEILTEPAFPNSKFKISPTEINLDPGKDTLIKVTFSSDNNEIKTYLDKLIFVSNQYKPNDSIFIYLRANTIPPIEANLSISRNLSAKPGSIINIPIELQNNDLVPSVFATDFSSTLQYNSSILKYIGNIKLNTASESSSINVEDNNEGVLSINMNNPSFFNSSDTLIILRFKVYLGNSPFTEIAFNNPVLGDNNCPQIMNTLVTNGKFRIDSICGLEYKALPFDDGQLIFNVSNYFSDICYLNFEIPYQAKAKIELFDIYGNNYLLKNFGFLQQGNYNYNLNLTKFVNGLYIIRLSFDKYFVTKKILISK